MERSEAFFSWNHRNLKSQMRFHEYFEPIVLWLGRAKSRAAAANFSNANNIQLLDRRRWSTTWLPDQKLWFWNLVKSLCMKIKYTQWRHKSKKPENLGRCGRQNMLLLYLKIWEWEWIFDRAVKAISSPGVRSPWYYQMTTKTC